MKVVVLQSSPRIKGNTAQVTKEVVKHLEALGAEIVWYDLNTMSVKGCQSCYACKKHPTCVIKDDGAQALASVAEADAVIFATPVYMWDMTGQLKTMFDRMFAYMNMDFSSKLAPGKKTLWIVTQGQPDPATFQANFEKSVQCTKLLGFGEGKLFISGGFMDLQDISANTSVIAQAKTMAEWLQAK